MLVLGARSSANPPKPHSATHRFTIRPPVFSAIAFLLDVVASRLGALRNVVPLQQRDDRVEVRRATLAELTGAIALALEQGAHLVAELLGRAVPEALVLAELDRVERLRPRGLALLFLVGLLFGTDLASADHR